VDLTGTLAGAPDASRPAAMFGGISGNEADSHRGARGGLWLALREIFDDVRFFMKNRASFDKNDARRLALGRVHLEALIPVVEGKLPLVLYVHRAADILAALRFAREQGVRLVIAGGLEAWTVAKQLAAANVPVLMKPSEQVPGSFDQLAARDDAATLLHRAGVRVVLSAVEWDQNIRRLRQEAGTAVAHGLPHAEAVRAITSRPAEVFGKAAELGTVSAGKRANLVLWSGDPLEIQSAVERVWIDGVAMPLDNRQRELVERYQPLRRPSGAP
jgi:imidazolonepropionase-like amidohydrolase